MESHGQKDLTGEAGFDDDDDDDGIEEEVVTACSKATGAAQTSELRVGSSPWWGRLLRLLVP